MITKSRIEQDGQLRPREAQVPPTDDGKIKMPFEALLWQSATFRFRRLGIADTRDESSTVGKPTTRESTADLIADHPACWLFGIMIHVGGMRDETLLGPHGLHRRHTDGRADVSADLSAVLEEFCHEFEDGLTAR